MDPMNGLDSSQTSVVHVNQEASAWTLDPVSVATTRHIPEILAPAGGREQFFAALRAGADAVYLGLRQFNARSRAQNFSVEELRSLIPVAHKYKMKVLVTLNIVIKDVELKTFIETLMDLSELRVDGVIVQDLGVASIIRRHCPWLRLHASTQLAIHNLSGVREAINLGFKRVVLARELTALEVGHIRKEIGRATELEVFCHGSLCYSYSGLCFFSGSADARSGNRGECAYTCREPYKIVSEPGHGFIFSMRDLDTSAHLDRLVRAGVDTLKIEGRKKDAQYVTSVVRLYRTKLNELFGADTLRAEAKSLVEAKLDAEAQIRKDLSLSFQRQSTSFFVAGRYVENVVDLNAPSHLGIQIGSVKHVDQEGITVALNDRIELHDGLKIVNPARVYHARPQEDSGTSKSVDRAQSRYDNAEFGMGVQRIRLKGRDLIQAESGMIVEIVTTDAYHKVEVGDVVYKSRSADLKRRVEKMTRPPADLRERALRSVSLFVSPRVLADEDRTFIDFEIEFLGQKVSSCSQEVTTAELRRQGTLTQDIKDIFQVFGDEQILVDQLTFDSQWVETDQFDCLFVPKSVLKEIKRSLGEDLYQACENVKIALTDAVTKAVLPHADDTSMPSKLTANVSLQNDEVTTFQVKLDRLEDLAVMSEHWDYFKSLGSISEVVFEPKKSNLTSLKSENILAAIDSFEQSTGRKVRLALPMVMRQWDEPILKMWVHSFVKSGRSHFEVGNLGGIGFLKDCFGNLKNLDLAADFSLYALNGESARQLSDLGIRQYALSIEDDLENLTHHLQRTLAGPAYSNVAPQVILYKDTPLFIAEACSLTALHNGCPTSKVCGYRSLAIENRKGEKFHVAHEGCKSVVYGDQAFSVIGHRKKFEELGVRKFRVDLLTRSYSPERLMEIMTHAMGDQEVPGTHTANIFGRLK
jgi:U32 family peptidase